MHRSSGLCLFLLFSISNVSCSKEEIIYVTPTQPPNAGCPQNVSCHTLQYYYDHWFPLSLDNDDCQLELTMMLLSGNHTVDDSRATRLIGTCVLEIDNIRFPVIIMRMIGLNGKVVIHSLEGSFAVSQLTIENIVLHRGMFTIYHTIDINNNFVFHSVTLINHFLYVIGTSGDLINLQAYNSQLHITHSVNVTFIDCMFRDFNEILYPGFINLGIQTAVTVYQSHVAFTGTSRFYNNQHSALISYSSTITLAGSVSFVNNTAIRGGAIALYSSTLLLTPGASISFINNSAQETGGAIHIEPDLTRMPKSECFYQISDHDDVCNGATINLYFKNNSAENGGDEVYGSSLIYCQLLVKDKFCINTTRSVNRAHASSVSSDPLFVCICDSEGQPHCTNTSFIYMNKNVHPGETLKLSAAIVGVEYGMTLGIVHAGFLPQKNLQDGRTTASDSVPILDYSYQYTQWIGNTSCTALAYTIFSECINCNFTMHLTGQYTKNPKSLAEINKWKYCEDSEIRDIRSLLNCRYSPIYINVTILPCPFGFRLLSGPPRCGCYSALTEKGVRCVITDGTGYFIWNSALWINVNEGGVIYSENCPLNHCTESYKEINLIETPNAQCTFNRAGRLCGGCRKGYSLAIGSSNCIRCPNNHNISLLIFFIAAGFLLVIFVSILNLTITQGMVNGIIFYANIVWTSQSILFPVHEVPIVLLRTFLAWINLDFGIETCFVDGLTALGKTWLQFLFPAYVWVIAGLMIITAKYSKTLTKIYGSRSVPVLATLFLLSYMKLLRTVVATLLFTQLSEIPSGATLVVWSVDGELDYFGVAHVFLLIAALAVILFLWLPYTLSLLFLQQLQKVSNSCWLLKWVNRLNPFYDAHFAPFKSKHRYWFGLMLLTRGVLLVLFASTVTIHQSIYLLIVVIFGITLLLYVAIMHPFKSTAVLVIQSSSLANLIILGGFLLYAQIRNKNVQTLQTTAVGISTGLVFIQFCGLTLFNVVKLCRQTWSSRCDVSRKYIDDNREMNEVNDDFLIEYQDSREVMESLSTH